MGVKGLEGRAKDRDLGSHVFDREYQGAEDGDHSGLAEGDPFYVGGGEDWEHGGWEVGGELASSGDEIDEGLSGLTAGGGSHHSTTVV